MFLEIKSSEKKDPFSQPCFFKFSLPLKLKKSFWQEKIILEKYPGVKNKNHIMHVYKFLKFAIWKLKTVVLQTAEKSLTGELKTGVKGELFPIASAECGNTMAILQK